MYSVRGYGKMLADRPRVEAYVAALRSAVRPGSVVIDLGSGPGFFAITACQLGARRVFAIEPDNVIQIGRDAARDQGFGDRIEFIQDVSTNVILPERADVIVSDLRGVLPLLQHHITSIIDARTRFLTADGVLIPKLDRLWATVVEVPAHYATIVGPWEESGLPSGRNLAVNDWSKTRVQPENFLAEPVNWYELDYYKIEEQNIRQNISFPITRNGTAHGLAVWFDAELIDGVSFSNRPGGAELIYGNAFFPFAQPLTLEAEDLIDVRLEARLIGDDYAWRWDTTLSSHGKTKCTFKQSNLLGAPLSVSQLKKSASDPCKESV